MRCHPKSRTAIRLAILAIVLLEVVWIVSPRFGSPMRSSFRRSERTEALRQYAADSSETTMLTVRNEMHQLEHPVPPQAAAVYAAVLLIANGLLIASFWRLRLPRPLDADRCR